MLGGQLQLLDDAGLECRFDPGLRTRWRCEYYGSQPIPDTRRLLRKLSDLAQDLGNN